MKPFQNKIAVRDAMVPAIVGQSFFQSLKDLGLSTFELQVKRDGSFSFLVLEDGSAPFSLSNIEVLRQRLYEEDMSVCALILGTDFSGLQAQQDIEWSVQAIHAAYKLGAPVVRLDPATAQRELPMEAVATNVGRALKEILRRTRSTDVAIGMENHGSIANSPDFLDSIFKDVADERLGMTLDTANFYWWGVPLSEVYKFIERFAPLAKHTHMKSICYPFEIREEQRPIGYEYGRYAVSIDQGDIDMNRIVGILHDAGYTGALCIENETLAQLPPEVSAEVLKREIDVLRVALEAAPVTA